MHAVTTTSVETRPPVPVTSADVSSKPSCPAAAMILAVGIGAFALGIVTTLNEALPSFHSWLQFNDRVGPLAGKTSLALAAFFGSWGLLTAVWRRADPPLRIAAAVAAVLVVLGLVGTFPPFFLEFTAE